LPDRDRDVLTTGQVARLCNVAPRTVSKWFDTGQLRGYRIPGSKDRRIPLQQLIRFMKAHGLPLDGLEGDQIRVLIVEPDRDLASLLQDTLGSDRRLQVVLAVSAFEAGALAQELQPHVLVLDVDVPGIDAVAITRFITGRVELQAAHLIATGAGLGPADRSALLQEGFQTVLPKPYQVRELAHLIDRLART
jgi:excisionase family DNA binding protein